MRLFTFHRSLATYRVRIALALKGLEYDPVAINLLAGEQFQGDFAKANPEGSVPLLEIDGHELAQSIAIMEYLEETRPDPALLPTDAHARALARRISLIAVADSHPLIVPRVRRYLATELGLSEDGINAWARNWLERGCAAMETIIADHGLDKNKYLFGDQPGIVEACIIPHLHGLRNFGGDPSDFARLLSIEKNCTALEAFQAAHPKFSPDFPTQ